MARNNEQTEARQLRALELRARGMNYADIAKELGYADHSGAYKAVQAGLKRTWQEAGDEVRQLELARLDRISQGVYDQAVSGDPKAITAYLAVMDRRARLLGLDQPKQTEGRIVVEYTNEWRQVRAEG